MSWAIIATGIFRLSLILAVLPELEVAPVKQVGGETNDMNAERHRRTMYKLLANGNIKGLLHGTSTQRRG